MLSSGRRGAGEEEEESANGFVIYRGEGGFLVLAVCVLDGAGERERWINNPQGILGSPSIYCCPVKTIKCFLKANINV